MTSHYDVLGIGPGASIEEIKAAYYARARLYHPDAHVGSPPAIRDEAERTMQALNAAWTTLRDRRSRRRYDRDLSGRVRSRKKVDALSIGSGFSSWMGATSLATASDGRPRLNLRVNGAESLAGLGALAPDGLWGLHAEGSLVNDHELRFLSPLTGLQFLDLTDTAVTDAGLVHLLGLENLETISLWDTAVTDDGVQLLARLPRLRQLGLGNTSVSDAGLRALQRCRGLRLLQLWGTAVEGPGLVHLHGLPELEMVTLPWKVKGRYRRQLRSARPSALVA